MNFNNRRLLISRRAVVLGGVAACYVGSSAYAQANPVSIGVGADPGYTPVLVAAHEKLFAVQGVDVIVKSFSDGGTAMDALVAQQVNLASASEPTTLVRLSRADVRPIAVVQESGRIIKLVVRKGITSPKQIKKFGLVPGSVSEYVTSLLIKKSGIDTASVQLVKSGPPELPALLARGDVDAFFVWEPWPTNGVRQGGEILMTSEDVGYKTALWLSALGPWFEANRAAAQAILKAIKQGAEIARTDPQRAAAAVQAVIKTPPQTTLSILKDLDSVVRDFNDQDVRTVNEISEFLTQQKAIPAPVDPARFLQLGFFKG